MVQDDNRLNRRALFYYAYKSSSPASSPNPAFPEPAASADSGIPLLSGNLKVEPNDLDCCRF
jgi:hypothetical protein